MTKLPSLKANEVLRVLLKAGFYVNHQRGSHARLFHESRHQLRVTIPIHSRELPDLTLRSIIRQSGLTDDEFVVLSRT
jgi:predicted RNA binding protein YcfA (HicA-like mRNA interferase family)